MGSELAPWDEWSHERSLPWHLAGEGLHAAFGRFLEDLGRLYHATPALWDGDHTSDGFSWIDATDVEASVYSWLRHVPSGKPTDVVAVVLNLTPVPRMGYRLGLPLAGRWEEAFNTDSEHYGGSNLGNLGGVTAVAKPWHGRPASAEITLPPLAALILRPAGD
jgi:1,4-alpha-glucan branching enzyme